LGALLRGVFVATLLRGASLRARCCAAFSLAALLRGAHPLPR
jgi:hypothetical protein